MGKRIIEEFQDVDIVDEEGRPLSYQQLKTMILKSIRGEKIVARIVDTNRVVHIIINSQMHGHEAIVGIYDSFSDALNTPIWKDLGEVPDKNGLSENYYILSQIVQPKQKLTNSEEGKNG